MSSSDPFTTILIWILPALGIFGQLAILIACIFGALHPSLRREFIWLGLGSAVRLVAAIVSFIPLFLRTFSHSSSYSMGNIQLFSSISAGFSNLGLLLYLVGFILLAVKARSLPPPPR